MAGAAQMESLQSPGWFADQEPDQKFLGQGAAGDNKIDVSICTPTPPI